MAIRMTGMNSGLDTDSIVQALMSAKKAKRTKISDNKTKLEWKKEEWGKLNTSLLDFYKNSLGKIKMQGTFKTKAATSSDTSKVTATAASNAAAGSYRVKVNSLASAQYVTSGKLNTTADGKKITNKTKLTELRTDNGNGTFSQSFSEGTQIAINSASGTKTLLIDADTTVEDFVNACDKAGLNASFDAKQQRFFISSDKSGEDQKFTITAGALDPTQQAAVSNWKNATGYEYLSSTDKNAVSQIFDQLQAGTKTYDDVKTSLNSYMTKGAEKAVKAYYSNQEKTRLEGAYFDASDPDHTTLTSEGHDALIAAGKTDDEITAMTPAKRKEEMDKVIGTKVDEYMARPDIQTLVTSGISNGIGGTGNQFLDSDPAARELQLKNEAMQYRSTMSSLSNSANQCSMAGLGLGTVDGSAVTEGTAGQNGMVCIEASSASVEVNGATLTSDTSTLTVSGLTLNILSKTEGDGVTISVSKDTSGVYDSIKDFLSEYNTMLSKLNTYYNAASSKGYNILTDEQKEAMSEDEITKWNDKIKGSLLRRDDTVGALINSLREKMMGTYTASDGKKYSLSTLGISTSTDYKEGGLLHIKGDEDDTVYADEDNTLETMLNEKPDLVMEIMNGLTGNLYNDMADKMKFTRLSSAMTFYNDKEMSSQLSDYKKEITAWDKKLATMEDRYYAQFTAMEKSMASLNSQQSSISNFFG